MPAEAPSAVTHNAFRTLDAAKKLPAIRTAVANPCDPLSLGGALQARKAGLIEPVLVGAEDEIRAIAKAEKLDLGGVEIVNAGDAHEAAKKAVSLASSGDAVAVMKGALHTDEIMAAVVAREAGLRTGRRMSHVFSMDIPEYHKCLHITDAALNICPDLATKKDITQNALELVRALGVETPKAAIMSAVETVRDKLPATLEAAALCKMADRRQITGGIVDGPFAFDNAVSKRAAKAKKIESEVAGDADILVMPNIEAGNMVAKQLVYLARSEIAGIVLGARVPVILTSRADTVSARLASCKLAQVLAANKEASAH